MSVQNGRTPESPTGPLDCPGRCSLYVFSPRHEPSYFDSADQFNAALHGFIWPKVLWDFILPSVNVLVTPIPYLQMANLVGATLVFVLEWPCWPGLSPIGLPWRCLATVAAALPALLLYQGTNAGLYLLISAVLYIRAHQQEEARWIRADNRPIGLR